MARLLVGLVLACTVARCLAATSEACGAVAVIPKPDNFICGGGGVLESPLPLVPSFTVADEQACADECELARGCVSFGYKAGAKRSCQLYSQRILNQEYKHRRQDLGTRFFNQRCFTCASDCNIRNHAYAKLKAQPAESASAFCSQFLGYPISTISTVLTTTTTTESSTETSPDASTTTSTTTTTTSTTTSTSTTTTTTTDLRTASTTRSTTTYIYQTPQAAKIKRAGPAASRTSAACSCFVDPSTTTITKTDVSASTITTTSTVGPTSTVTSTNVSIQSTVTTTFTTSTSTSVSATTTTSTIVENEIRPAKCNVNGLPAADANNYDTNYYSSPASCIATCKSDPQCLSTGGFYDGDYNGVTYSCFYFDQPVANSANLGGGYYTFNDKACPPP